MFHFFKQIALTNNQLPNFKIDLEMFCRFQYNLKTKTWQFLNKKLFHITHFLKLNINNYYKMKNENTTYKI